MKKSLLGLCTLTLGISLPALADFSAEVSLGSAKQTTSIGTLSEASDSDTSFGVKGVYTFHKHFAVELGYRDFGEISDSHIDSFNDLINDTVSSETFTFGLKGIVPLSSNVSLIARVGAASWDWDIERTDSAFPGEIIRADDSGTDVYYGVGVEYAVNDRVSLSVDYTAVEMDISLGGTASLENEVGDLSLSLGFAF